MKKLALLFLATLVLFNCENESVEELQVNPPCDNGTFIGLARLKTQAEVNAFGELCYTKIDGGLVIGPSEGVITDITNLTPLESLIDVYSLNLNIGYGKIHIINNGILTSLQGLQNITKAAGILVVNCPGLTDLNGLEGIVELNNNGSFNDLIIQNNTSLQNFDGLHNLRVIGFENNGISTFMSIQGNPSLKNINALSNLETIYGFITIGGQGNIPEPNNGNLSLTDYCGLQNLFSNGYFENVDINLNAFNPTVQDIIDGNCSQ